jgi:4'-phosphopantetheinyl transferase
MMTFRDEVHLWWVEHSAWRSQLEALGSLLSQEECRRARRYRDRGSRVEFIVSRGVLRLLVSRYVRRPAGDLCLRTGPHGKPELVSPGIGRRMRFSLSHSDAITLCAVTWNRRVGVDVERVRSDLDLLAIAERQLAIDEAAAIRNASGIRRLDLFYRCWTRREACLKARGEALATASPEASDSGLQVIALAVPAAGYAAALAVERGRTRIRQFFTRPALLEQVGA